MTRHSVAKTCTLKKYLKSIIWKRSRHYFHTVINNLRYVDDTVLVTTLEGLQELLNRVADKIREMGPRLNIKQPKRLVISKQRDVIGRLAYDQKQIKRIQHYKHLGCILNTDWGNTKEIRSWIEHAQGTFIKMKLALRTPVLRCYVFSIHMYGAESWILTETTCKRLSRWEPKSCKKELINRK